MEELLKLNDEVEKIAPEELAQDLDSPLMDEYNVALDKFITVGRKIFNNDILTYDELKEKTMKCAIKEVQNILNKDCIKAHDHLLASSRTVQKVMEKLEYILVKGNNDKESTDFLSNFSNKQLESFKALQEYIRSIF